MSNDRRIKKIGLAREVVQASIFREPENENQWQRITKGVPQDAEFLKIYHDPQVGVYWAVFRHSDWEHIPFGEDIPEISIEVETRVAEEKQVLEKW